jgi:tetratricopeptide (TPR) repeat protein/predicted Ser/Thr protein kinase
VIGTPKDNGLRRAISETVDTVAQVRALPRGLWLDLLRSHQADAWRSGQRVPAEEYLGHLPEIQANTEELLVLICGEVHLRRQLGDTPDVAEYQRRFPELAEELTRQFELDALLDGPAAESSAETSPDDPPAAPELPGYEFLDELGCGAFGVVYLARQTSLNRLVAIKVLAQRGDPRQTARQHREAEILARLQHPHVVQIYEVVPHAGWLHLVMEYVEGPTLKEWADGKPLSADDAVRLTLTLAETIQTVHEAGILHRDLKPTNILISANGQPKLTDFGLARWQADDNFASSQDAVLGTPCYMAPEQAAGSGASTGPTADVYSLGAILYELLTGRPPFLGASVLETLSLAREREPVSPRQLQPGTPRDLETICLKCLAKSPEKRYESAGEIAEDLRRYKTGRPILARRASSWEKSLRWCRRNPGMVALATCLQLALIVGLAATLWKWRDAEQARRAANTARQEATLQAGKLSEEAAALKMATELLERGRVYIDLQRWDDADRFFSKAIELRRDLAPAWQERSQLYAQLGLWDLAWADGSRAFALHQPALMRRWREQAALCCLVGDETGYRRICEQMREQFHRTNFVVEVAHIWCLMEAPAPNGPPDWLVETAEVGLKAGLRENRIRFVAGLARYRAGDYPRSIALCRDSLQAEPDSPLKGLNYPVLAMAHYQLGQVDESRLAMQQAADILDQWIQQAYDGQSDRWIFSGGAEGRWPIMLGEYLAFRVLNREAQQLLDWPAEDDPRVHVLRGRALSGVQRYRDADAEFLAASGLRPDDRRIELELHRNRAYMALEVADYARAAQEFASAAALRPDDSDLPRFQAMCYLLVDDHAQYRQVCRSMRERFGQTDQAAVAHDIAEAWVLRPVAPADCEDLVRLANVASHWYFGAVRMQGAALCRAGRYEESLRCFQDAERFRRLRPWDWAFQAMAHQGLGRAREARACLAEAQHWIDRANQEELDDLAGTRPSWGSWYERPVDAGLLLEEARSLVEAHAQP